MRWTEIPKIELGTGLEGRILALPLAQDRGAARSMVGTAPIEEDFYRSNKARIIEHGNKIIVAVGVEGEKDARIFGAKAWNTVESALGPVKFHLIPDFLPEEKVLEGALLASYRYDMKTEKKKRPWIVFHGKEETIRRVLPVVKGVYIARDIANAPANEVYPEKLAEMARELLGGTGVDVEVYPSSWLEEKGFGGIVAVGKGSANKPRLIVMKYLKGRGEPVLLVGKGVCFDAGGIHLKPTGSIEDMKMDVSGGAAVIGAMYAVATIGLKVNVVGIVPAVENLPSAEATKPGDVVKMYNGKTVEVVNTDAEGRLIIADAIAYGIERFKPSYVVDLATLTGACIVALGKRVAGIMGNDGELLEQLKRAGKEAEEEVWELPMFDHYGEELKSEVADLKNVGEKSGAGAIIGAKFLENFAGKTPWAHIDIAGPAIADKPWLWNPKGGTGFGVRLVVEWLKSLSF